MRDYCHPIPQQLCFGLAWDITNGRNIDLDASVIMLDANLNQVDIVFFGKLRSSDGSIQHGGDEREGDEKGDDEKVFLNLNQVHPSVKYVCFTINSYSGEELDDVAEASTHLFDPATMRDLLVFKLTNTKFLDKHTALVVGYLFRDGSQWGFKICAEAAQGRTAQENVDEFQRNIRRNPPQPLSQPRVLQSHAMPAQQAVAVVAPPPTVQMAQMGL